jgi:predicted CopG family antitoxin
MTRRLSAIVGMDDFEKLEVLKLEEKESLLELIREAIEIKRGNKEFSLNYYDDENWSACIGNRSKYVHMMEGGCEFYGEGKTPKNAVLDLISEMKNSY